MKKIFSIGLWLVVWLILCLLIGHAFKGTATTTTLTNTTNRFSGSGARRFWSWMNFSWANRQFSWMNANGSGRYYGWSGRNGTGMGGSGYRQGMWRRNAGTGTTTSPSQLLDQGLGN